MLLSVLSMVSFLCFPVNTPFGGRRNRGGPGGGVIEAGFWRASRAQFGGRRRGGAGEGEGTIGLGMGWGG
jgi:hypothetical protein